MTTVAHRLDARLDEEEPLLVDAFPSVRLDRDTQTVLLPDYRLPAGWSQDQTDVLFVYPANYPAGCPDNVCTRPDLRLASGHHAQNNQGTHIYAGRDWLQLSWHIDAEWRPSATAAEGSNLVTYLIGALARFDDPT